MTREKKIEIRKFLIPLIIFELVILICTYQGVVRSYNSTMLALSYEYGFTSRSLLGTIYHVLNFIIPIDIMNYGAVLRFAQIVTGLFFVFVIYFSYYCLKNIEEKNFKTCEYILFFFDTVTIATFSSGFNFLRVDLFMVLIAILSAIIISKKKFEWLIIPLSAIGVMFHQGFVFMYFNVALVLLFYQILTEKKKAKYIIIFSTSLIIGSILFVWFELLSRTNGAMIIDSVLADAKNLAFEGKYHSTLIAHEVLGVDLATAEWEWHKMNFVQMILFTLLFVPYIIIFVKFFVRLFKNATSKLNLFKYVIVLIGSLTMLPDFLLKIDYGRWIMSVVAYYAIVICALVVMKDEGIIKELAGAYDRIKEKRWSIFLLVYPIMFVPLCDTDINGFVQQICAWLNGNILHWYNF